VPLRRRRDRDRGGAFSSSLLLLRSTETNDDNDSSGSSNLEGRAKKLNDAFEKVRSELTRTCKVRVGTVSSGERRLGIVAAEFVKKNDVVANFPYDDRYAFTVQLARTSVFEELLPDEYEGWTGDAGLIAMLLLNEVARASAASSGDDDDDDDDGKQRHYTPLPERDGALQQFMTAWVEALPLPDELDHPLLWSEEDQELLQSSSTNKIYKRLDDVEEDYAWLEERVFEKHREKFPKQVTLNGRQVECFTLEGFKWAVALALSRSYFVDGCLRLLPVIDMCNHSPPDAEKGPEVESGTMGTFGTTRGLQLRAGQSYQPGQEVFCSYGPKSAADYLLEHGFVPDECWTTSVAELTFELDSDNDRFYDDKLDILEFETYEQAPMDPVQQFDVVCGPGQSKGEPDPALLQFVRLQQLGSTDAFLLESIFRKDVWGFMALPVSESNELKVVETVVEACRAALEEMKPDAGGGNGNSGDHAELCTKLRESETKALIRTVEYLQREKEALDLKEYYQERRLKDLGLDSDWNPEDDLSGEADLQYGQTRTPGGADYDW